VLINLDKVGGIGSGKNDLVFLGKCDNIIRDLAKALGWEDELDKEWMETAKSLDNYETPYGLPGKNNADEGKANLEHELAKITDRVGSALSLSDKDGASVQKPEDHNKAGSGQSKERQETIPEPPKIPETGGEEGRRDSKKNEQVGKSKT